jgi:Holliday junction resolvase
VAEKKKINSKAKGAKGERELSNKLKEYGFNTRRGQQYCGANGDADVVGLPGIHIECKRVEKLNIYDAVDQSKWDSTNTSKLPAVFHRKNNCEWLVTMPLDKWIEIYREWANGR